MLAHGYNQNDRDLLSRNETAVDKERAQESLVHHWPPRAQILRLHQNGR